MTQNKIKWSFLPWSSLTLPQFYQVLRLRQEVFIVEQNCPFIDADNQDQTAYHLIGLYEEVTALYTRIYPPGAIRDECVIGRVVVSPLYRGKGFGYQLMQRSHEQAIKLWNADSFFVSAQSYLRNFYERLGYVQMGPEYLEDDIPHIPMHKIGS